MSRAIPLEEARRRCLERMESADRARFEADCGALLAKMVEQLQTGRCVSVWGSIIATDGTINVEVRYLREPEAS